MNLSAVILAGGESRRMGRDKAWLEWDGQPLIARALQTAREAGIAEVLISGRADTNYRPLNCPVLIDEHPGLGPLSGIARGLQAARSPLVLILAVDLPFMSPEFLQKLQARCAPAIGAVPKLNGSLQPLAAIYPSKCLAYAQAALAQHHLSACEFAEVCMEEQAVRTLRVAQKEEANFANWNCPDDLPGSGSLSR